MRLTTFRRGHKVHKKYVTRSRILSTVMSKRQGMYDPVIEVKYYRTTGRWYLLYEREAPK